MEAAGLGIGIAGLAGLFSACLDIIEKVDSYKDFGFESDYLFARFDADRVRFRKWGENVGINQEEHHHSSLDDPAVRPAVDKILQSIRNIDGGTEDTIPTNNGMASMLPQSQKRMQFEIFQGETSRRHKFRWTLRGKARFITIVEAFDSLVQKLHDLVPTSQTTAVDQMALGAEDKHDTDPPKGKPRYSEAQRVIAELKKHTNSKAILPIYHAILNGSR